ncbi:4-hydroxybenzoate octaprenyltransferase [Ectothiorhodospira magna]|uniref:4-hydroxybenzoate octaprenyltransferase n=1 Tax=Ectothiorhodospira magna TaxID=867345 RepID=UPI000B7D0F98|nr:4-hydroxybenzoate octaprenyltransferase [Ectothiorhodospira magna]
MSLRDRLVQYALLTRLHRPIGILLLLWPTLWALWIAAEGMPDLLVLFVFVAGVALMRSAGCAINDFADRDIDGHVTRTRDRPLASRRISAREAVGVTVALALTAFALVLLLNPLTIALSVVALVLAVSYPFMKRFHHLPQVHLGAAFGWAVPMAFAAQTGEFPPPLAWLLFLATILWTTAYDTMYAMVDRPDDLKIGVKSSAILFGEADRLIIGILQALTLVALALVGLLAGLGGLFYLGLGIAALLACYQQYLIRDRNPKGCFEAFLNNNWFGLAVFAGIIASYLFSAG